MSRLRFSIRSLLLLVLFVGVAFAALRASNDDWDAGVFGVTLLVFLSSVLLAVHRSGRKRSFWLGFVLFGWAYFGACFVPPVASRLPTTKGLASLDSMILRTTPVREIFADIDRDGDPRPLRRQLLGHEHPLSEPGQRHLHWRGGRSDSGR